MNMIERLNLVIQKLANDIANLTVALRDAEAEVDMMKKQSVEEEMIKRELMQKVRKYEGGEGLPL